MRALKIDKRLPTIILPKEKTKLFMEWFKNDLCNEENIPEVFNEGYFYVDLSDLIQINEFNIFQLNGEKFETQKKLAEAIHDRFDLAIIYFKFIKANTLTLIYYSQKTGKRVGKSEKTYDVEDLKIQNAIKKMKNITSTKDNDDKVIIDLPNITNQAFESDKNGDRTDYFQTMLYDTYVSWSNMGFYLLISALWYLGSIKNKKESVDLINKSYNNIKTSQNKRSNQKRSQNYVKSITTPIYDLAKTSTLNINKLMAKKRGWKISCEFSVRGHYRHYKSGKVVFVKSFEKGKGLKVKQNIIKLSPKC